MSRRTLFVFAAVGLCACNPRKPLTLSKDLGPAVQVVDVAPRPYGVQPTAATPPLAEAEPNDDREHAQKLDPQKVLRGSLLPPTANGAGKGDDDFYQWPPQPAAQTLRIEASGAPDLTLEAVTESGQSLGVIDERGAGEGERIVGLSIRANQSIAIRVRGRVKPEAAHTPTLGEYQLAITATPAAPDSEAEPNDTVTDATPMLGNDATGALSSRRDEDYFALSLPSAPGRKVTAGSAPEGLREPAILRIELTTPSVQPTLRVFFEPAQAVGADGGVPAAKQVLDVSAPKGKEELRIRNVMLPVGTGRVLFGLRGLQHLRPPGESRYHLRTLVETPLEGAENEPNDSCQTTANALAMSAGSAEVAGFLWPGDADCFHVTGVNPEESTVEVKLNLPGGDCSATVDWVTSEGKPTAKSASGKGAPSKGGDTKSGDTKSGEAKGNEPKSSELTISPGGDFFLRVQSRDKRTCFDAPYRLTILSKEPGHGDKP